MCKRNRVDDLLWIQVGPNGLHLTPPNQEDKHFHGGCEQAHPAQSGPRTPTISWALLEHSALNGSTLELPRENDLHIQQLKSPSKTSRICKAPHTFAILEHTSRLTGACTNMNSNTTSCMFAHLKTQAHACSRGASGDQRSPRSHTQSPTLFPLRLFLSSRHGACKLS